MDTVTPVRNWRYGGRATIGHRGCVQPRKFIADDGTVILTRCGATQSRACRSCADRHRRDVRKVLRHTDSMLGMYAITLTAPGNEEIPGAVEAAQWNGHAPTAWSEFVCYLRRALKCEVRAAGVWETHRGGLLHRHGTIKVMGAKSERTVRQAIRSAAIARGFGTDLHVGKLDHVGLLKWSHYMTEEIGSSGSVLALDRHTGEMRPSRHRRWSASRNWGCTLAQVRSRPLVTTSRTSTDEPIVWPPPTVKVLSALGP